MSNPFEINEKPVTQFGNFYMTYEEKQGKNGSYFQFNVTIAPLGGGDLIDRKYFNFQQTPNDTKIFLAGLNKATNNKPMTLVNPDGAWVEYGWETFRDYGRKTVEHYENKNPDKLQADEKGRFFVEKGVIKLVRVFADENECIAAHDSARGIESSSNGAFAVNGESTAEAPPVSEVNKDTAAMFLPWAVKTAMNGGNKVNKDTLEQMIAGNDALKQHFTIDSPEVLAEIEKLELEAEPAF